MASTPIRKNPMAVEATAIDSQAGSLAGAISTTIAARVSELVTRGMSYAEAQELAEAELFGCLRTCMAEARHG